MVATVELTDIMISGSMTTTHILKLVDNTEGKYPRKLNLLKLKNFIGS